MTNRKSHTIASLKIEVGKEYNWLNGTVVKVSSIWSDKYGVFVSYQIVRADDEPELIGRKGDGTPNSFYWQMHAA